MPQLCQSYSHAFSLERASSGQGIRESWVSRDFPRRERGTPAVVGWAAPLVAIQLLWINLVA